MCYDGLKWIDGNKIIGAGIPVSNVLRTPYPEVTGYFIPTLLNFGQSEPASQFARWLMSIQKADGSWSDPSGATSYTFDSGQVLKGLLAILPRLPEAEDAIRRGCEWMLAQIKPDGRVTTPDKGSWILPGGEEVSENIHLYTLEALRNAGALFKEPRYIEAVERALAYYLAQPVLIRFNTLSHFHAYVLEALVDLGCPDVAANGIDEVERLQKKDGSIPAYPDVSWVCSTGIAQYATIWYKLGKREPAEKALGYLSRIQNRSGGFFGSYGRGANYFPDEEISWAVKFTLDAYHWHIRTAFDAEVGLYSDTIEESDGRFQAILKGLGDLSGLSVLDAGCGKGRFARALLARYPSARICGVDISDAMLLHVPPEIKTKQGSLLNLPFSEGRFDRVYCVEALEHAIDPSAAISELCRVVRPGGRIVVVDKNVEHKGTLEVEAWEQWFQQDEVEMLLSRHCRDVRSEFISYGERSEPDGLFIVWQGTRT
jgi:malonyl-CoA O-methyltransferase